MVKKVKKTLNHEVAEWLIEHRWRNNLNAGTRQMLPSFVEDSVMSAVYIVAGTSNGKVNVSPKLVFKCLMIPEISVESVRRMEVGYDMSQRQAQRLAQTTRFALKGIASRVQSLVSELTEIEQENIQMERDFTSSYYNNSTSMLYSERLSPLPESILSLYKSGQHIAYGEAARKYRIKEATLNDS